MKKEPLKRSDIVVLALALVTVVLCLIIMLTNPPKKKAAELEQAALVTATPAPTAKPTPEPTAEPTPEPTPEPTIDPNEEMAFVLLEEMNTEEKVYQLFMATPESVAGVSPVTISGDGMAAGLASYPVGGLVYASQNTEDSEQIGSMLAGAQERSVKALFLAYNRNAGTSAVSLAGNMKALGFNFGLEDSEDGLVYAAAYKEGMDYSGLKAVIVPLTLVLSGEESIPACTSSDLVTGTIREADGWDGLILTDCIGDGVEDCSAADLAVKAIEAGCDMILAPNDLAAATQAVLDAVVSGRISEQRLEEAVQHILFAKLEAGIIDNGLNNPVSDEPAADAAETES